MVWFRIDDSLSDHPKLLALQKRRGWEAAIALWTLAGAWASKHLTDGVIPRDAVTRLGFKLGAAALLVDAGFWEHVDADYKFHDWHPRNPLREQVERDRAAVRNRVAKHRGNGPGNGVTPGGGNGDVTALVTPPPSRPVPARPDPTHAGPTRARAEVPPGEPSSDAAQLAQLFAERTDRLLASADDLHSAREIVAQVGDRWRAVFENWWADPWVLGTRPPLSNLAKRAHKHTAPAPVDPAEHKEQIRRARVAADDLEMRARLRPDIPALESAAAEAKAVLDGLRARGQRGGTP